MAIRIDKRAIRMVKCHNCTLAKLCYIVSFFGFFGYWRVYYPDSNRFSQRMDYYTAKNYAEIFNGMIYWEW